MVTIFEIVFLIICVSAGVWWISRTKLFRAHTRSGIDPGQRGSHKAL